jgi:hypothetical protein
LPAPNSADMADPPRRSRRPQQPERGTFPLIPILLGVIVAGFALGALLSMLGRNSGTTVANVTPAPLAAPSLTPLPKATLPRPTPLVRHTPARPASPKPKPKPKPTPAATPRTLPNPAASAPPSTPPSAAPASGATRQAVAFVSAAPSAPPTEKPTAPPHPPPAVRPPPNRPPAGATARAEPPPFTAVPRTEVEADSDFARSAATVVQTYLAALARGDDEAARATLTAPSGSAAAQLSEKAFAGPDMRIAKVDAHGTADSARVDVDIDTPRGAYFAQFYLKKSASGAVTIVNHNFIKP